MMRARFLLAVSLLGLACLFLPGVRSQPTVAKGKKAVKLEPIADTKLLMVGLANPNLEGLGKLLSEKPKDADAWGFARSGTDHCRDGEPAHVAPAQDRNR